MNCANCSKKIEEYYNFCGNCGEKITKNKVTSAPIQLDEKIEDKNNKKIKLRGIFLVIAGLIFSYLIQPILVNISFGLSNPVSRANLAYVGVILGIGGQILIFFGIIIGIINLLQKNAPSKTENKEPAILTNKKKGTNIKKIKIIATILYVINFIFQIVTIFIVYNTSSNPENIKEPPINILFIILTLLYFNNLFSKNKKITLTEYEPWYKNKWGWFTALAIWPIIIFLVSFILMFFINNSR